MSTNIQTVAGSRRIAAFCAAFALGLASLLAWGPARAIETAASHALILDAETGAVLLEKNADVLMPPASMSKLMTLLMVYERLRNGSLSLNDTFPVSENAWKKGGAKSGGSTMFLNPFEKVRVEDLIRGIAIQSGNDACIVLAEGLSGSEEAFARAMTARAREMGLRSSTFRNSTGLPDPQHLTTAHDLALLAKHIIQNYPEYYHYDSEKYFTYNGIRQGNRNPLIYRDLGADGLKTGHTDESGYGLTASAVRNGRRLIMVLNGLPTLKARAAESETLIEWGFREFDNFALLQAGEKVADAEVWLGEEQTVPLILKSPLTVTLPRKSRPGMKVTVVYNGPISAPIAIDAPIAKLVVTAPDTKTIELPLVAGREVEKLGLFGRLAAALKAVIWGHQA